MMDLDASDITAGTLGAGWIIREVWNAFRNRKVDDAQSKATIADATGKTALIEALEARIAASETRQNAQEQRIQSLETRIAEEINLRLAAQEQVFHLRMRLQACEAEIIRLGGTVPTVGPEVALPAGH